LVPHGPQLGRSDAADRLIGCVVERPGQALRMQTVDCSQARPGRGNRPSLRLSAASCCKPNATANLTYGNEILSAAQSAMSLSMLQKNSKSSGRSSYAILGCCLRANYEHCKLAPPWMAQARPPPCSRLHGCRKPAHRRRREPASRRPSPVPPPCPAPPRITARPPRRPRRHARSPSVRASMDAASPPDAVRRHRREPASRRPPPVPPPCPAPPRTIARPLRRLRRHARPP
jgi:hypothetical protein